MKADPKDIAEILDTLVLEGKLRKVKDGDTEEDKETNKDK